MLEQLTEALAEFNARLATTGRAAVVPFPHPTVPEVIVSPAEQSDGMVSYTAVRMNEPKI